MTLRSGSPLPDVIRDRRSRAGCLTRRSAPCAELAATACDADFASFGSADRREFDSQTTCLDRLDGQPIGRPIKLLFSGRFRPEERGAYERMLQRLREDWMKMTGASDLQVVPNSGHYIQKDRPDAVIKAVEEVTSGILR